MPRKNASKDELRLPGEFIGLPGIFVTQCHQIGGTEFIESETSEVPCCPACGGVMWRNAAKEIICKHTPMNGLPCKIRLKKIQWKCGKCGTTLQSGSPACLAPNTQYTKQLVEYLNDKTLTRKLTELEQETGISDTTLSDYAKNLIQVLDSKYHFPLSTRIGLDEVKISGKFRTIVTNLDKRTLIDLCPARQGPYLVDFFTKNFTLDERKKVVWICTDMWRSFCKHLAPLFPNASWVVDKWHVLKGANQALNDFRICIEKTLPTAEAKKKLKKQLKWSLLVRRNNPFRSQDDQTALEADLKIVQTMLPQLWTAYGLKESFFEIYDHGVRSEALKAFEFWEASIPSDPEYKDFRKLAKTFRRNMDAILNFWDSGNLTNAFTECENNLIRAVDRAGRGYNFDTLRGRVLFNKRALAAAELRGVQYGPSLEKLRDDFNPSEVSGPAEAAADEEAMLLDVTD